MEDAKLAVETGVDGVDVVIGTSKHLREHSHGKDMAYITKTAIEVIEYVKRYVLGTARGRVGTWARGDLDCKLTHGTAKDAKCDSHPKIPSDLTSSTCCHCTRLLMLLAFTVLVLPIRWVVPLQDKSMTSSAR